MPKHAMPKHIALPVNGTLRALTESDIEPVIALAKRIWLAHYVDIVGLPQVEYMIGTRYTAEQMRRYLGAEDRWFDVLKDGAEPVGYCSYALTDTPTDLKLEQLYLLSERRGRGLGGFMLRHVEERAQALACRTLVLQVNKRNTESIAVYKASGFAIRQEVVFDLGHGFVMDDHVMEKRFA